MQDKIKYAIKLERVDGKSHVCQSCFKGRFWPNDHELPPVPESCELCGGKEFKTEDVKLPTYEIMYLKA